MQNLIKNQTTKFLLSNRSRQFSTILPTHSTTSVTTQSTTQSQPITNLTSESIYSKWSQLQTGQKVSYIAGTTTTIGGIATLQSQATKDTYHIIEDQYQSWLQTNTTSTSSSTTPTPFSPLSPLQSQSQLQSPQQQQSIISSPTSSSLPLTILTDELNTHLNSITSTPASIPTLNIPFSLLPTAYAASAIQIEQQQRKMMTPVNFDGILYPSYGSYMEAQGFIIGSRNFDKFGPYSLVGLFAALTIGYQGAQKVLPGHHAAAVEDFYFNHMTLSYDNRMRPWVYFTNAFTHFTPLHLLANTMALTSFAPSVGVLSAPAFLTLFSTLALSTSILSLGMSTGLARGMLAINCARPGLLGPSVGASGVIAAMVSISALTNPNSKVSILGLTPSFNILYGLAAFMTLDMCGLIAQCIGYKTGLSHTGHISGYLCGMALFALSKFKFESKYQKGLNVHYGNWIENVFHQKKRGVYKRH